MHVPRSFAGIADVGLQVTEKQTQLKQAPRRWVFRPAQLPAVTAVWLHVSVQCVARVRRYPESVLAADTASSEALTLSCGLTSSYLGSSTSFNPPSSPPTQQL